LHRFTPKQNINNHLVPDSLKPVAHSPSISPSHITAVLAIFIIPFPYGFIFSAFHENVVCLAREPLPEPHVRNVQLLCLFRLPTIYLNKVYFPFFLFVKETYTDIKSAL
jgi:hypothetical protein